MHHHSDLFMWSCYLVGQAFHVAVQVNAIATAKNNPVDSRIEILRSRLVAFGARLFISTMLFVWLWDNPGAIVALLSYVGWNVSERIAVVLSLPMGVPIAGLYGYFSDSLLAYIPGLKSAVPLTDSLETKVIDTKADGTVRTSVTKTQITNPSDTK